MQGTGKNKDTPLSLLEPTNQSSGRQGFWTVPKESITELLSLRRRLFRLLHQIQRQGIHLLFSNDVKYCVVVENERQKQPTTNPKRPILNMK